MSGGRRMLGKADFSFQCAQASASETHCASEQGFDFAKTVTQFERALLEQTLRKARGNKTLAAQMLGMKRTTLVSKLRSLEVTAA